MKVNPYINFNGTTEEAFNFYKSVFGGEFATLMRFKDVPQEVKQEGGMSTEEDEKIMHVALPLGKEGMLMGSDVPEAMEQVLKTGNNISISLSTESKQEADEIFAKLSQGGKVEMPLENMFWGDYFGMVKDRFGVGWMITYGSSQPS